MNLYRKAFSNEGFFYTLQGKMKYRLVVFAIWCVQSLVAQPVSTSDSLKQILFNSKLSPDKEVGVLLQIARNEQQHGDIYDADLYTHKAFEIAKAQHNKSLSAECCKMLAEISRASGRLDSSLYYLHESLRYYVPSEDRKKIGETYNEIGLLLEDQGDFSQSFRYYLKALREYEDIGFPHGIGSTYLNIGLIHYYRKDYKKAEHYFNEALKLARENRFADIEVSAMNNLGMNFHDLKNYNRALQYFLHVLQLDLASGDKGNIAHSLNNVGTIYADNNEPERAIAYFLKSAGIKRQLNDHIGLANCYNNLAEVYIKLGRYGDAETNLRNALDIATRSGGRIHLPETYLNFYKLHSERKNYRLALDYYIKYHTVKDSMLVQEKELAMEHFQKQYELDKANHEIDKQTLQIEGEKTVRIYFVVLILLLLVLCVYFIYSIRRINRLNRSLKRHQYDIESQNDLLRQKNSDIAMAKEHAEEAAKAKGQFLSMMSHEIRTPLNAIIGIANLLNESGADTGQRKHVQVLKASSDNLLALINDILDLSKIESGKLRVEHTEFCLRDLVENLNELFLVSAREKGLSLQLRFDARLKYKMIGDPLRINQILSNLLSNAIKFTHQGGVELHVDMAHEGKEFFDVKFEVTDTGIGIPEDKVGVIFESFEQADMDTSRMYGGTGLGLSICKQLLEILGSSLLVHTRHGHGSTFYFTIRFSKVHANDLDLDLGEDPDTYRILEGQSVLIAEDNPVNIYILKQFLNRWKMHIFVAQDGRQSVETALNEPIDIVLMDIQMPLLDGYEASRRILAEKPDLPILAITAATLSEVTGKMREAGIIDYVPKPFQPHELADKLMANLGRARTS